MNQVRDASDATLDKRGIKRSADRLVATAAGLLWIHLFDRHGKRVGELPRLARSSQLTVAGLTTGRPRSTVDQYSDHVSSSGPPGVALPHASRPHSRSARAGIAPVPLRAGRVSNSKGARQAGRGKDDAVCAH